MCGMLHLVYRTLLQRKGRTLLTLASVVIAFVLFALLGSLRAAFNAGVELAGADRLMTSNSMSFIQPMPVSYVARIRALEGIHTATHFTWFGAYFQDPRQQFGLLPTELPILDTVYPELSIPPEQKPPLMANRRGLLVGRALAERYGWQLGDSIPLFSSIYPTVEGSYAWDFQIEAMFTRRDNPAEEMQAYMHYQYFNETRAFAQDLVGWIVTRVHHPEQAEGVAAAIDARFANSPTETRTATEAGFAASFAAQFGDIGLIVQLVLVCVFFTLLLVTGNTMAQSVRERRAELAVLKTLGFSDIQVVATVLTQSLLVALGGAIVGLALGAGLVWVSAPALAEFFPGLAMDAQIVVLGLLIATGLGVLTGAWPAWRAGRLCVVAALRRA